MHKNVQHFVNVYLRMAVNTLRYVPNRPIYQDLNIVTNHIDNKDMDTAVDRTEKHKKSDLERHDPRFREQFIKISDIHPE
ncbi:hypothetical protein JTB14_014625 [Gonioctena quinquepunctata]|nr:hypothetical protein JTB14_014625 [Gonioctena quinquepunctata]